MYIDYHVMLIMKNSAVLEIRVIDVYHQLKGESTKWNEIARELRISHNYREELRMRNDLSNRDRLEMALIKWKESQRSDVSWDKIIMMLRDLDLNSVASKVMQYLLTDEDAIQMYGWKEK